MAYFQNKVVLVTGGSTGLGYHIAEAFAARQARVVIVARGSQRLDQATSRLHAAGHDVTPIVCDVTEQVQVDSLFSQVHAQFGRLDALVNNVGRSVRGTAGDTSVDQFQQLFDMNFLSLVRCTRAALPDLIHAKGHLINVGSLSSKIATRYLGAYPVTKFAVAAYSQQLRLELRDQGVHVLLVCPGPIVREDSGRRYDEQAGSLPESSRQPAGGAKVKAIRPEYVARRIVRCCERRTPELVVPAKARWLAAINHLWPRLGDAIIRKVT